MQLSEEFYHGHYGISQVTLTITGLQNLKNEYFFNGIWRNEYKKYLPANSNHSIHEDRHSSQSSQLPQYNCNRCLHPQIYALNY